MDKKNSTVVKAQEIFQLLPPEKQKKLKAQIQKFTILFLAIIQTLKFLTILSESTKKNLIFRTVLKWFFQD